MFVRLGLLENVASFLFFLVTRRAIQAKEKNERERMTGSYAYTLLL